MSELLKLVVGACAATKAANRKETNGMRDSIVEGIRVILIRM